MSVPTITRVATTPLTAAMPRPWVPSAPWLHLVRVDVECSDGVTGTGFSWTPTIGAEAVRALIDTDIARFVVGRGADARTLWADLWRHLHEAGGGGVTTIAMAGVDLALWDAAGRRASLGLADAVGRIRSTVGVYGSGVNLHYSLDELVAQAQRWVGTGYDAVKIKVGKPDVTEDVDRVAAVRDVIGPDRQLMIDANQRWDVPTAVAAIGALERFDPHWIEEPLRSDDTLGYLELRGSIGVPVALGENVHTIHRFRELASLGAADILQPNVVRVGGITPFLEIADLVDEADLRLAPHLLPELSGQLAMCIAQETRVERVEDADLDTLGLLAGPSPVVFHGPTLTAPGAPGIGIPLVERSPL
ncbi:mandelate racemase/muconate lactonizing enzyme family protein [Conyzicola sp.]|uniref:mandelate racemase/muconate lactonizing enzyme family protein n=1 Tax=Conyzicola sp. TaxID=1969404 RepID=UPI0039899986